MIGAARQREGLVHQWRERDARKIALYSRLAATHHTHVSEMSHWTAPAKARNIQLED